jgi:hypothetical protein
MEVARERHIQQAATSLLQLLEKKSKVIHETSREESGVNEKKERISFCEETRVDAREPQTHL